LGTFAQELSLWIFRLGIFTWGNSLDNLRLGSFAWKLPLGIFRLGTFVWDLSLGNVRLGSFAWELSFGILRLGTFAWELSPLGTSGLGNWAPEAGGTAGRTRGNPGGPAPLAGSLRS
jgi:hypothetical protein